MVATTIPVRDWGDVNLMASRVQSPAPSTSLSMRKRMPAEHILGREHDHALGNTGASRNMNDSLCLCPHLTIP